MIKLLIVTPKYPPQTGGASYVFNLIGKNIQNKIDDIYILTSTESGFIEFQNQDNIKVIRLFPYFESKLKKLLLLPFTFSLVLAFFLLYFRRFNVVETHTIGEITLFSQFFSKLFKKKLIKHILDMQTGKGILKIPPANAFVCCGDIIQNKLKTIRIPTDKIYNIHLPIKKIKCTRRKTNKKRLFLFVGEISKSKGVLDILDVISKVKREFKIGFIGDGPLLDMIVEKSKKDKRIVVYGRLDHSKVIKLLKKSDVLIHPSYSDVMPISILEAMMLGNAIISTDIGEIKKNVGNGGIIIKPGDKGGLETAIECMLETNIETYKENSVKNFLKYSKENVYSKNLEAIKNVLISKIN